jgi:putative colanic acid biosynthesis UDP-glucose lipid carrier transferase
MNLFYLGKLDQVQEFCLKNEVQEIYVALNCDKNEVFIEELTKFVDKHFIYLGYISSADTIDPDYKVEAKVFDNGRIPVISYRRIPLRFVGNLMVKRAFDIIFSSIVLLILGTTLFPIVALAIKLTSKGPVFYTQKRPGFNNKFFDCYKFRTMVENSDQDKQTMRNDRRITKIGLILRKTSLDELPQFFNVLKGDMSVVGPRPNLIAQLNYYGRMIEEYSLRHAVVPGITGYAQVNGYRGATNHLDDMQKRIEHDIWYLQNWTLRVDLQIIGSTVLNIFKGEENAY